MPLIEYIKDYKRPGGRGRTIPKGSQGVVGRARAKELEASGHAVIIDAGSGKEQQRRAEAYAKPQKSKSKPKPSSDKKEDKKGDN